jgi:hypothetical protein
MAQEDIDMSKLKIERGASKLRWVQLKINVEESIAADLELMCKWSDNDRKYVVNELLRFALSQSGDFQKYKSELESVPTGGATDQSRADEAPKTVPDSAPTPVNTPVVTTGRQ